MRFSRIAIALAITLPCTLSTHSHAQTQNWTPGWGTYGGCTMIGGRSMCSSALSACVSYYEWQRANNSVFAVTQYALTPRTPAGEPYECTIALPSTPTKNGVSATENLFIICPTGQTLDPKSPSGCVSSANAAMDGKSAGSTGPAPHAGAPCLSCPGVNKTGAASTTDPIDIGSGNVFYAATDYETAGQNPLRFTRYYNSRGPAYLTLGANWRSTFDRSLFIASSSFVQATRASGQVLTFTLVGSNWTTDTDTDVTLARSGSNWTLTDSDGTSELYIGSSSTPWLSSITWRNGYVQTLNYTSAGKIGTVNDSYGRMLTFTYNTDGTLASLETPDGNTLTYGYTATIQNGSNLTSVTYPTSPADVITYAYESATLPNALTGVIDEAKNRYLTWTYDANGRGLSSKVGNGSTADITTISYNDSTRARTVTNSLGVADTYSFTMLQNVPKVTSISRAATATTAAATETFSYDANGYLASKTDWNGNRTTYVNSAHGFPTTINEAVGTAQARTTTIAYNTAFPDLPEQIVTPGLTIDFAYDSNGEPLTKTLTDTTTTTLPYATKGQTRIWTYSWVDGLLASVKTPNSHTTSYMYLGGVLTKVTNPLSQSVNVTSYTTGGFPETIVDANNVTTKIAYDARMRPVSSTVVTAAGNRTTTSNYLDTQGSGDKTVLLPDGSSLTSYVDPAHRLNAIADKYNNRIAGIYDSFGDVVEHRASDPGGSVKFDRKATFDALGRKLKDTSIVTGASITTTYDKNGNTLTVKDGNGHTNTRVFDALNRLTKVTDANAGVTTVVYDAHDRPTSVTAPNNAVTSYVYNGFGDVIRQTSPDSGATVYHYDADANLTSKTDGAGVVTNQTFDALDRVLTTTYPADTTLNVTYIYDQTGHGKGVGRLTSVKDKAGSLSRSYDERGNLLTDGRTSGATVLTTTYTYDPASRVATITYPSGSLVTYTRDSAGRITNVSAKAPGGTSTNLASAITYLPYGPVLTTTGFNSDKETFVFDTDYRMTSLVTSSSGGGNQHLSFGYDNADNVTRITDAVCPSCSQALVYDVINRLTSATGWFGNASYTFDKNGNFLTHNEQGYAATYGYTANTNKVSSVTISGTSYPTSYSGTGNLTSFTAIPGQTTTLAYNKANQIASNTGFSLAASYIYDGFGQRFSKTDSGSPATLFVYDQDGDTLEESNNGIKQDYIFLDGRPIGYLTPATKNLNLIHGDKLGSPVEATDSAARISWSLSYLPYGGTSTVYSQPGATAINQYLRFPGQYFDVETYMNHNGFRDLSTSLGRYVQSDPIGLSGGTNTYSYVGGNPLGAVDRTGLVKIYGDRPNTVHANPGPNVTDFRAEHNPAHVHLGANDGPSVRTDNFEPLTQQDANRMTRSQIEFCKRLSEQEKALIRIRAASVFETGTFSEDALSTSAAEVGDALEGEKMLFPVLGFIHFILSSLNGDDMFDHAPNFYQMFNLPDPNREY